MIVFAIFASDVAISVMPIAIINITAVIGTASCADSFFFRGVDLMATVVAILSGCMLSRCVIRLSCDTLGAGRSTVVLCRAACVPADATAVCLSSVFNAFSNK